MIGFFVSNSAVTLVCENPMGIFTVYTREPRN